MLSSTNVISYGCVILVLSGCGGGGDSSDNVISTQPACRNYASSFMEDTGVNVSCTFDSAAITLSCLTDVGENETSTYPSIMRFIEEVGAVGRITLVRWQHYIPYIRGIGLNENEVYDYDERGRFLSSQMDWGLIQYSEYDELGRPGKGSIASIIPGYIFSGIVMEYDDVSRQHTIIYHDNSEPPYSEKQVKTFDENGNLIKFVNFTSDGAISSITTRTITSTDTICETP